MLLKLIPEILEEIAYQAVRHQDDPLRPPFSLLPLLLTCRYWNSCLCLDSNPSLYARIFSLKFDAAKAASYPEASHLSARHWSSELRLRCTVLKRLRSGEGSHEDDVLAIPLRLQTLWTAFLMILEHEDKNLLHLRDYARANVWTRTFLLEYEGGSSLIRDLALNRWPVQGFDVRLAMWIFWFLHDQERLDIEAIMLLKTIAMGGYKYELCYDPWNEPTMNHAFRERSSTQVLHYDITKSMIVPPISAPAILLFLSALGVVKGYGTLHIIPTIPYPVSLVRSSMNTIPEWATEWKCTRGSDPSIWIKGCIDGTWEGPFIYTDFNVFANFETALAPFILRNCEIAHHDQLWNLREYHSSEQEHLPFGDALNAFFPQNTTLQEKDGILTIHDHTIGSWYYQRDKVTIEEVSYRDVIVMGEGHSNWGRFTLRGRVRKSDGFLSVLKRYGDGPRGDWLYRGYLVGHPNGNLVGRWRETITPANEIGYEGCFSLARRR